MRMSFLIGQLAMTIEVVIQDARAGGNDAALPALARFAEWVNSVIALGKPLQGRVTVRVVDAAESRRLNARYRGKDKPTNVLSFHYDDAALYRATKSPPLLGDLVMCAETLQYEAQNRQRRLHEHWAHLTIHGMLHLLGYDHDTAARAQEMERLEVRSLAMLGIGNPYEVRGD